MGGLTPQLSRPAGRFRAADRAARPPITIVGFVSGPLYIKEYSGRLSFFKGTLCSSQGPSDGLFSGPGPLTWLTPPEGVAGGPARADPAGLHGDLGAGRASAVR